MSYEHTGSDEGQHAVASGKSGPSLMLIGLGIAAALFIIFFLQNGEHTRIDFLVFEKRTTIRWSLLVAVLLGILIDRAFSMWWRRRRGRTDV